MFDNPNMLTQRLANKNAFILATDVSYESKSTVLTIDLKSVREVRVKRVLFSFM